MRAHPKRHAGTPLGRKSFRGAQETTLGFARLIAVSCADPVRLNVILTSIERRIGETANATFASPIGTCRNSSAGSACIKRSTFEAMLADGTMTLIWRDGAHGFGYPQTSFDPLLTGTSVVIGIPMSREPAAKFIDPRAFVIRVASPTDPLRHQLMPHASFRRAEAANTRRAPAAPSPPEPVSRVIQDNGSIGQLIARVSDTITSALQAIENERQHVISGLLDEDRSARSLLRDRAPVGGHLRIVLPPV
jgi:hypothetical protein